MNLIEALEQVTADDLAAIDKELAALKTRLDSLKAVRRVAAIKINGRQKRKSPTPKAAPGGGGEGGVRGKILAYLAHVGAASVPSIASGIRDQPKNMYAPLNHEFFCKDADGLWKLTAAGRAAAGLK